MDMGEERSTAGRRRVGGGRDTPRGFRKEKDGEFGAGDEVDGARRLEAGENQPRRVSAARRAQPNKQT